MPSRRKLIVVSNRAPVAFNRDAGGERIASRGGGGLVTGLRSLVSHHDVTWIASAMSDEDRVVAEEARGEAIEEAAGDGSPYRLHLVPHDPSAYDWYYNVVANPVLWFIQHYLWGLASSPDVDQGLHNAWSEGYVAVNRSFADATLAELEREPDAAVFFHDYHLYVAPRIVRERAPHTTLAHFVHVPWAMSEYWRVLPEPIRRAVHEGILANDVVSFPTPRWRRNFLRSCEDVLDAEVDHDAGEVRYGGQITAVRAHAISVDPGEFDTLAQSPQGRAEESAHPEMHGRVQMLALLDPSRQDIPEYAEYLGAIQRAARVVNDRFQQEGWLPLAFEIQDDFLQAVAAYKQFDVLLVNAIFDGMNLIAKEAPLVNTRDGVLILSENAGAHEELGEWALTVNPFDVAGQAEAIHEAITMAPGERRERLNAIKRHVREHDIGSWIEAQLQDLDEARERTGSTLSA